MLISVELMLNGAGLALVASARLTPASDELGQLGTLLVMGLAAAEATLVLAMVLVAVKRSGTSDSDRLCAVEGMRRSRGSRVQRTSMNGAGPSSPGPRTLNPSSEESESEYRHVKAIVTWPSNTPL